jgi:hypothetical protein
MKSRFAFIQFVLTMLLLSGPALQAVATTAQNAGAPLSKQEILSQLSDSQARRVSQADIATEIQQRGISFVVDDSVIKELVRAGARSFLIDAVKDAGKRLGKPQMQDPVDEQMRPTDGADPSTPKLSLLEQARQHALEFADSLPDFIVNQVVLRYGQGPGDRDWRVLDKLELEITYRVGKGEQFKLLRVDGKPARQSYEEVGGTTSTGEFASLLMALFVPHSQAEFKEVRREAFRGRPAVLFDFKVKKANSSSHITVQETGQETVAGYAGTIWVDEETKYVLRIESSHEGMPPSFPITLSENAVEYDWVTLGAGERYLLPTRAELLMGRDREKTYTKNIIEFKDYRKFEGKIKMDPN